MALNIKSAKEVKDVAVTGLLYCAPGTGKTTTLGKLKGKTLVVDIDHTSGVLKGNPNVTIIELDTDDIFAQMNELLPWLKQNAKDYDNICFDNISSLQRAILAEYGKQGKNDGVPSQGDYQKYQFKLLNIIRFIKGLKRNAFFTAWEEVVQVTNPDGSTYTSFYPQINARIRDEVCGECNLVGHIEIKDDGRVIRLEKATNVYAKNQIDERKGCLPEKLLTSGGTK